MEDSKLLYGFISYPEFSGCIWDTPYGKIVVCHGDLDLNHDLLIKNAEGDEVDNIDLRNTLMFILKNSIQL